MERGPGDPETPGGIGPTGSTGVPEKIADSLLAMVSEKHLTPDVNSVSVRAARYSFLQLSEWRELLEPTIWASDDIAGLDLDEENNQLTVLLEMGSGEAGIRAAAQLLGLPSAALGFEVEGELEELVSTDAMLGSDVSSGSIAAKLTLQDKIRPTRGGTQHAYLKKNGKAFGCTYGFTAVMGSDTVMVTNSHCTPTKFGGPLNGIAWQANYYSGNPSLQRIGTEFIDPPAYGCGYVFWECRKNDAAAYLLEIPQVEIGLYQIARTTYWNTGTKYNGSLEIDSDNPDL